MKIFSINNFQWCYSLEISRLVLQALTGTDIEVQGQNLEDSSKPGLFFFDYSF